MLLVLSGLFACLSPRPRGGQKQRPTVGLEHAGASQTLRPAATRGRDMRRRRLARVLCVCVSFFGGGGEGLEFYWVSVPMEPIQSYIYIS